MSQMNLTRRQFFKLAGSGVGVTSMTAMGLAEAADPVFTKPYKLEKPPKLEVHVLIAQ